VEKRAPTAQRFAVILVPIHLAVAVLHGISHGILAVPAGNRVGLLVIAATVYVGPLVAIAQIVTGRRLAGAVVLSTSMAAALAYGLAFHYVLRTPDHVASTPPGTWGVTFRATAAVLALLEAGGLAAGVGLMRSALLSTTHAITPSAHYE